VENTNVPNGNVLADKVKINLNMLGALVLNGVGGEVDDADIVVVDQSGPRQGAVQLHKQLMKPTHLCHVVGHDVVLRLSAQTGDDVLTL
jgi:poly-beta-hydroxyalkanoate depolymerase